MPRPCSAEFKRLTTTSRVSLIKVEIINTAGTVLASSDPSTTGFLKMYQGSVTMDISQSVVGSCALTLTDPTGAIVPTTLNSLLSPGINEVKISAGYVLSSGAEEYVSLGVFSYDEVDSNNTGVDYFVTLSGYDRSGKCKATSFPDPFVCGVSGSATFDCQQTLIDLVTFGYPRAHFKPIPSLTPITLPNPTVFAAQANPWDEASKLATLLGCWLYCDQDGDFVVVPVPDPSSPPSPDWTIDEVSNPIMVTAKSQLLVTVYNGAVVTSDGTAATADGTNPAPAHGEWWNTDPQDPTSYNPANPTASNLGPRPEFYASPYITTDAQALSTAQTMVAKNKGSGEALQLTILPNPAMELLDGMLITDSRLGISGRAVIVSSFQYTLSETSPMQVNTRQWRILS